MRVLFVGGTGFISTAVSQLAVAKGLDLFLLNRGVRRDPLPGANILRADIHKPEEVTAALRGLQFDVVVDWIAYTPADIERDLALFRGMVQQYIFISSASAYQKPPTHYLITESTPLHNPYWQYSRDKIACEERLIRAYREEGVEANIVHIPSDFIARVAPSLAGSLLGDKAWSAVFDNSKIKSFVPAFQAAIPFREGIKRTV